MLKLFEKKRSIIKTKVKFLRASSINKNQSFSDLYTFHGVEQMSQNEIKPQAKKHSSPLSLFRQSLENVLSNSTSHGIPNIVRTENWLVKVFWAVLFIAGFSIAIYCK